MQNEWFAGRQGAYSGFESSKNEPKIAERTWSRSTAYKTGIVGLSGGSADLDFIFIGKNGEEISLSGGHFDSDTITVRNKTKKDIDVKKSELYYQVIRIENGKDIVVCDYKLPSVAGGLPAGTSSACMGF